MPLVRRTSFPLLRALRPHQWVKNLLVLLAPAGAGMLLDPGVPLRLALLVAAFSMVASGMYLDNDVLDADVDGHDPRKRARPVASGEISPASARLAAVVLVAGGLLLAARLSFPLVLVLLVYVVNTALYSRRVKHVPYLEVVAVAAGFVLRALAGAIVTGSRLSVWFLVLVSAVASFVVLVKRAAEMLEGVSRRPVLGSYDSSRLAVLRRSMCVLAVLGQAGWVLETGAHPFAMAGVVLLGAVLWRGEVAVSSGRGAEPARLVFTDPFLAILAVVWFVVLLLTVG